MLAAAGTLRAADKTGKPATTIQLPPKPLLPQSFAGWTATATPQETTQPTGIIAQGDHINELMELGFRRESIGTYRNGNESLILIAVQFQDATGAYGMYSGTGLTDPAIEDLSSQFSMEDRLAQIMRMGDSVVIGFYDKHPSNFNVLAKMLPIPTGSNAQLPILPQYLPKSGLNADSVQYALGPFGFAAIPNSLGGQDRLQHRC